MSTTYTTEPRTERDAMATYGRGRHGSEPHLLRKSIT